VYMYVINIIIISAAKTHMQSETAHRVVYILTLYGFYVCKLQLCVVWCYFNSVCRYSRVRTSLTLLFESSVWTGL